MLAWKTGLLENGYDPRGAASRMSNPRRVEAAYGNLDDHYDPDRCRALLSNLSSSSADNRRSVRNPSRIDIEGDLYNGLLCQA